MAPPLQNRVAPEPLQVEQPAEGGGGGGGPPRGGGGGGDGGLSFRVKVLLGTVFLISLFALIVFLVFGSDHQTGDTPPPSQSPLP
ncbi:hypothetical protein L195_g030797 [Trifolium pratense]|uniref:Uncharacterized protein n=1 Tax=Trifolium pratense TaxID=57577 RepID=A0A2K3L8K3_TRIPR|nr:hypothetical protein L195_g030797 [Trifolium pratense]